MASRLSSHVWRKHRRRKNHDRMTIISAPRTQSHAFGYNLNGLPFSRLLSPPFLFCSFPRNRCGRISGSCNHQFQTRDGKRKKVWPPAYLNKQYALRNERGERKRESDEVNLLRFRLTYNSFSFLSNEMHVVAELFGESLRNRVWYRKKNRNNDFAFLIF